MLATSNKTLKLYQSLVEMFQTRLDKAMKL